MKRKEKNEKKNCLPSWIRTPAARLVGDRSNHSTCHYVIECVYIIILKRLFIDRSSVD